MASPDPEDLLRQAAWLVDAAPPSADRPTDPRRAISNAYYAVFHAVLTRAADTVAGIEARETPEYALVYRSVEHATLRALCKEVRRSTPSPRYRRHGPADGWAAPIRDFARILEELQDARYAADYDPAGAPADVDAIAAIDVARQGLVMLAQTPATELRRFLTLLLFPPRR